MVRAGIVGCGNIGRVHAAVLKEMEQTELCGFSDKKPERARAYSDSITEGKGAVYESLEEMLEKEKPEVLHICTPHYCHVPMALEALKRGVHVFMEKPPAINRQEYDKLLTVSEESKARLGICFQNRYNETTKKVSEILVQGSLGKIIGGRAFVTWSRDIPYYTESGWRGSLVTEGGGALINQSIHTLDLLLKWLGKPVRTEASMSNHHLKGIVEVEDTLEAYMAFADGVSASFYATTAYPTNAPVLLEIACEKGFVRLEGDCVWCKEDGKDMVCYQTPGAVGIGKSYWGSGHEACIKDFYASLASGKPYANDLASVENTFCTMMDIYEAARKEGKG